MIPLLSLTLLNTPIFVVKSTSLSLSLAASALEIGKVFIV